MDDTTKFYDTVPYLASFDAAFDDDQYRDVPDDWLVVITDVVKSTAAIAEGKYKEVNTAGCLPAVALANVFQGLEFPFLFDGDGMKALVPPAVESSVRDILADSRAAVRKIMGLTLRAGIVAAAELYRGGDRLRLARLRVSDRYVQAMFSGTGIDAAEALIKGPRADRYLIPETHRVRDSANFTGYTCRWQDIPGRGGSVSALIVKPAGTAPDALHRALGAVMSVYESQIDDCNPMTIGGLHMAGGERRRLEARISAKRRRGIAYLLHHLRIGFEVLAVRLILLFNIPLRANGKRMNRVREECIESSDFRKYDGTLKMVVSGTREQTDRIEAELEKLHSAGHIHYGLHRSDRSVLTCVMHFGSGGEVHFVDAADGGYAVASRRLKEQMNSVRPR